MPQNDLALVELAQKRRLLTRKQAELIREELDVFPEDGAGALMLRRHYITQDQLEALQEEVACGGAVAPGPDDVPTGPQEPPPKVKGLGGGAKEGHGSEEAPPRQLSIADLKARQRVGAPSGPAGPRPLPSPNTEDASTQRLGSHPAGGGGPAQQAQPHHPPPGLHKEAAPVGGAPASRPSPGQPAPAAPAPPHSAAGPKKRLAQLLRIARHWNASDLHLSVGRPPFVRLNGQLRYMEEPPLSPEETQALAFAGLTEVQAKDAAADLQLDFALEIPKLGRYRANIFHQRLGWDANFRVVRAAIPTLEELGLPAHLRLLTEYQQGLVMVTGSGGSGKTTTAAALLDIVNAERPDHIITVEDPVEYIIPPKACQITQREVGRHTQSFGAALRAALREDPDIILVGEMRDLETTAISISAAETGHLVFATLNTSSAARTVAKIVDFYPISQQAQVQTMVAESLRGVITQQLIPRIDTEGVALAVEILINTSGIAQQIKEGKTHMITGMLQSGKRQGMMLMDDSLMTLVTGGYISGEDAYRRAASKQAFERFRQK